MTKQIVEIHSIQEVAQFLDDKTHLFLDLDNTLFTSSFEFGSERWERFMIQHFIQEGVPEKEATDRASHLWKAVQTVSEIQFVEKETKQIVQQLQKRSSPVYALTARDFEFCSVTEEQLDHLGIQFADCKVPPQKYSRGVFYCGCFPKGEVLKTYAKHHDCLSVVLVDDCRGHLEAAVEIMDIPFTGLRYGFLDKRKSKYTPCEITKLLGKIFTHPKACHFLRNGISSNYTAHGREVKF